MIMQNFILCISFLLLIAGNVHAASFDCSRATSEVEKLICTDQTLSKTDEELAALYAETLKRAADPWLLKRQQRDWLRSIRSHCIDVSCLRKAYAKRMKALSAVLKTMSRETTKATKSPAEACQVVADFANSGILSDLSVPAPTAQPEKRDLERIFGMDALDTLYGVSYWRIDLDNDGIPDHFLITVQGTLHLSNGYVLSGKKGSTVHELGGNYIDLSVLMIGERYYVLSHDGDELEKLWRLSKTGEFLPVCSFKQRKEPMVKLVSGKEQAVCAEAHRGHVHHVRYALSHGLGSLQTGNGYPVDGLAQVDINNDGTPDNVVRIDFSRPGGRRWCEGRYIAVTGDARTKVPDTKLNKILSEKAECDSNMNVFVHEGIAYVDLQEHTGNRQIYRIRGHKIETICEFRGHLLYDVVDVVKESEE